MADPVPELRQVGFSWSSLLEQQRAASAPYLEFLRSGSLSAGLYVLPPGARDDQRPHAEDEVYVVAAGGSLFTAGADTREIRAGDVLFVAAGVPHRFHDITEELRLIVVFAPPEGAVVRVPGDMSAEALAAPSSSARD